MEISVYQAHNVLRTYDHLIKPKSDRTERQGKKEVTSKEEGTSSVDRVTISNQSRARLLKEDDILAQTDSPPSIDEE